MTKTAVRDYAKHVKRCHLSSDDYCKWIELEHNDGSEIYFTNCALEYFSETDDAIDKWLIIWTKNHGIFLYDERKLACWNCGDMEDAPVDEAVILAS